MTDTYFHTRTVGQSKKERHAYGNKNGSVDQEKTIKVGQWTVQMLLSTNS